MDPVEFDELNALISEKSLKTLSPCKAPNRKRRFTRKGTRFPGQYGTCWYCGSHFVWGGNGMNDQLVCAQSRTKKCWNSFGFNGPLFVKKVVAALLERLTVLEGFDEQFRGLVLAAKQARSADAELKACQQEEDRLRRERENLIDGIAQFGAADMFRERIESIRAIACSNGLKR